MTPTLLISLVVGGVTAVVVLTLALGWSATAEIADPDAARALLADDFPDFRPEEVVLSDDRHAALLAGGEAVGAVFVLGDRTVTRLLRGEAIRAVRDDGVGVVIELNDPTRPRLSVPLADAGARRSWLARLERAR
jgi:hypothetical protein